MAKEKQELSLMEQAEAKMETMVEQHNELVQTIQEQQGRLAEVKQMLVEHQGYMKGIKECQEDCDA